jgi:hypothetical protein
VRAVLALALLALAVPAPALAGPTLTMREIPLHATRTIAGATPRFNMVGLHWRGSGAVWYRARKAAGRWGAWRRAGDDDRTQRGWHLGNLDWTGSATAIRFRTAGLVTRLRAYYVWSPPEPLLPRRLQIANAPPIIPRSSWGADETIRRHPPVYAAAVHFAVVHHTAGTNDYTRAQSAAIVRGIEIYHVKGNGWWDIGYNFLVDKYGQIFEGRYGGVDRPVIGAHAQGFNDGSVGVSVLGDYSRTSISAAAKAALEALLAWRLDVAHVDPLSTLTWRSGGNPRFPAGLPVPLRAISGHRDTGFTDCPGNALYAQLPQIAKEVAALGGPKIYAPAATLSGESRVLFTARLSTPQPWTVTVVNSSSALVAEGSGTGTAVNWTWDGSAAPPDRYIWTIASPNARSATGTLGEVVTVAIQKAVASPAFAAPNEPITISYTLTAPSLVTASVLGPLGQTVATVFSAQRPAGAQALAFTPPPGLVNGQYSIALAATAAGKTATASIPLAVDDILAGFTATGTSLSFTLTRAPATESLQVLHGTAVVATLPTPAPASGPQTLHWDPTTASDGVYTLALTIGDEVGTFTRTVTVTVDRTPPRITVLSYKNLLFRISEPATVTLDVGAKRYLRSLKQAGVTQFWLKVRPTAYRLDATDSSGNTSSVRYPR